MKKNTPKLIAILIYISGIVDIISVFWTKSMPRIDILRQIIPWNIIHASRTLTFIIGFFLVYVARGLWEQKRRAWELAVGGIFVSLVTHLLKGLDIEEMLFLLIPLSLLYVYRGEYRVQSARINISVAVGRGFTILVILFIYATFGFFAFQGQFNNEVTIKNIEKDYVYSISGIGSDVLLPQTRRAKWFEDSLSAVGLIAVMSAIGFIFSPFIGKDRPTDAERKKAHELIMKYGKNAYDFLNLMDDKSYYFGDGESFIAYKIRNGTAVTLGGPIGEKGSLGACIKNFINTMSLNGLSIVFTGVNERNKGLYIRRKLKLIKVGEEAIIKTDSFNLDRPDTKDVRNAVNKIAREGITFSWYNLKDIPWGILSEVGKLHNEWIGRKSGPTLTFSVDFFPFPPEPNAFLECAYLPDGSLAAAFNYYPYNNGHAMGLELMLRSKNAPNGIVEAVINEAVIYFKDRGINEISLGVAALSNIEKKNTTLISDKTIRLVFERFNQFYGFKSLFAFKNKFNPLWVHTYLAVESYRELPKVILATLQAQVKGNGLIRSLADKYLVNQNWFKKEHA